VLSGVFPAKGSQSECQYKSQAGIEVNSLDDRLLFPELLSYKKISRVEAAMMRVGVSPFAVSDCYSFPCGSKKVKRQLAKGYAELANPSGITFKCTRLVPLSALDPDVGMGFAKSLVRIECRSMATLRYDS
jgi:hypothetical protein